MPEPADNARSSIGILAYGSLIADPGIEIKPLIACRIDTLTPFPVEYARYSATRGGGPTAVPHSSGKPVKAEVLVLVDGVTLTEPRNLLWRRETRIERSNTTYRKSGRPNAVVVRDLRGVCGLEYVVYTDFNRKGKIATPHPSSLADAAVRSVGEAAPGRDGISYLIGLLAAGIQTELTSRYVAEVLSRTGASDLAGALRTLRTAQQEIAQWPKLMPTLRNLSE